MIIIIIFYYLIINTIIIIVIIICTVNIEVVMPKEFQINRTSMHKNKLNNYCPHIVIYSIASKEHRNKHDYMLRCK